MKKLKKIKETPQKKSVNEDANNLDISLSVKEVEFLRDLFGLRLPTDVTQTASGRLAELTDRVELEDELWSKIGDLCLEMGVEVGEGVTDYIVSLRATPDLDVFEIPPDVVRAMTPKKPNRSAFDSIYAGDKDGDED